MKHLHAKLVSIGFSFLVGASSGTVYAAAKKSMGMSNSGGGGKDVDRDFLISLPVMAETPQGRIHLEYNIDKTVGLALEAAALGEHEMFAEKQIEETGESIKMQGYQGSLLLSRYTEPTRLGGFFWTVGGGYRRYTAEWQRKPDDQSTALQLDASRQDEKGYLHHRVVGTGVTGTARVGYRWVASEWPVAIGGHLGIRHMTSSIKDVEVDEDKQRELNLHYSPTNNSERKELKNLTMTTPDVSIELGVVF